MAPPASKKPKAPDDKDKASTSTKTAVVGGGKSKGPSGSGGGKETFEHFMTRIQKQRESTADSALDFKFDKTRCKNLSEEVRLPSSHNGILYWMSRDQRVQDNWALLFAQRMALKEKVPLIVCFCLVPKFLQATLRMYGFMLRGLQSVHQELTVLKIPFHLLLGEPQTVLPEFIKAQKLGGVVTDFSPLRVPQQWANNVRDALPETIPLVQVDAHNIVPLWITSDKLEYAARTIRPKIHRNMPAYLTEFPPVIKHPYAGDTNFTKIPNPFQDWEKLIGFLEIDKTVKEVEWAKPGTGEGFKILKQFMDTKIASFSKDRNNPNLDALSNLSPWFHFGQISVARCILEVKKLSQGEGAAAFIEEAVVRRELSDNFCFYNNDNYDSLEGAYEWARKTLNDHRKDKRTPLYTLEEFERADTYDDLWNAAQIQMTSEGKMQGFLRMYWAKKILEWSESPEKALEIAIFLNDKYSLDGRDPNGYVGCMWSICGIHDQGWREREIFGKIRFMNYEGCKRKFDVPSFVAKYSKPKPKKNLKK